MGVTLTDILKVALSVVFPPAAVIIEKERCDADVLINCLLTVLGWIPGESRLSGRHCHDELACLPIRHMTPLAGYALTTSAVQAQSMPSISWSTAARTTG